MEQFFDKYKNIQIFLNKYRNYSLIEDEKFFDIEEFKNKMQITGYVSHSLLHNDNKTPLDIYIFKNDSKHIKTTSNFKKLLDKYKPEFRDIFIFTKEPLSVYIKKSIKQYSYLRIKTYLHKHFIIEINKGPLCSKHTILTRDEVRKVCFDLMTHGHNLPAISVDDPQLIWVGANVDDIVKIETISEITGRSIHYRIVTPASGKSEKQAEPIKLIKKKEDDNKDEEDVEDYVEEDIEEDYEE